MERDEEEDSNGGKIDFVVIQLAQVQWLLHPLRVHKMLQTPRKRGGRDGLTKSKVSC